MNYKLLTILGFILLNLSCSKDDDDSLPAVFFELDECFSAMPLQNKELIITTNEAYNDFQELTRRHFSTNCETASLPAVNFEAQFVIGTFTITSGCSAEYNRKVYYDSATDSYSYNIEVKSEGDCETLINSFNCAIVPKKSESEELTFNVTYK